MLIIGDEFLGKMYMPSVLKRENKHDKNDDAKKSVFLKTYCVIKFRLLRFMKEIIHYVMNSK